MRHFNLTFATAGDRRDIVVTAGGTWSHRFFKQVMAAIVAALLVTSAAAPVARAAAVGTGELVEVVVTRTAGIEGAAERAVTALGGEIIDRLDVVDGFSASVRADLIPELQRASGIGTVTGNREIELYSQRWRGEGSVGQNSLDHVRRVVGATEAGDQGFDGSGVGVAVLDTGVSPVSGLDGSGKLMHGPDVSAESGVVGLDTVDSYGHGTHLAGIIGGSSGGFEGVAPGASIVSLKAAPRDGSTDLLRILAALDWIVQHKDDAGIRVVNLSFGAPDPGDYRSDPLAAAVERVWNAGIVVVAAAGNDGEEAGSPLASPATDPYVIAVGSADTKGTVKPTDDTVQGFSPRGSAARRVDLVAPGQSIVSLRVPGSYADTQFPTARVGDRFFKGTGTSQATAVVTGVVASLLEQRPELTPDQVKAILTSSASKLKNVPAEAQGAGMVDADAALGAATPSGAQQSWEPAHLPSAPPPEAPGPPCPPPNPDALADGAGETETAAGCDPRWSGGSWSGGSWSGGSWSGGSWSGGSWSGGSWSGGSWSGGSWSGGSWSGGSWSGGSWSGGSWSGGSWSGGSWSGGSWSGGSWSGGSWSGGSWSGGSWSGGSWSGDVWAGRAWT